MGKIPQDFIDDLSHRVNIVDVVGAVVNLQKAGKEYKACCPFHKEKTPSFTVSPEKNFFHCFGCQKTGGPLQFMQEFHKLSFVEAVHELARQQGMSVPETVGSDRPKEDYERLYRINDVANAYYREQLLNHPQAANAQQYLVKRGLSREIIDNYEIGFAPPGWDNCLNHLLGQGFSLDECKKVGIISEKTGGKIYDKFRHRIIFPIRDRRGRIIGFGGRVIQQDDAPKYLNSPETPIFHKGRELYGLYQARSAQNTKGLICVEGYMDVIGLAQYGLEGAVATLGTATTKEHLELMFRFNSQCFFCFDGDNAGQKAAWRALTTALPLLKEGRQVRFLFLPQDEDPDTFLRKYGTDAFINRMQEANSLSDFFFSHLTKTLDLNQLDSRAELANLAAPLIQQVAGQILRELMYTRLSELVQLPLAVLKSIKEGATGAVTAPHSAPRAQPAAKPWRQNPVQKLHSPMRLAITFLLLQPSLAAHVLPEADTNANANALPGWTLLKALHDWLQGQGEEETLQALTTADILAKWPDSTTHKHLATCANIVPLTPSEGIEPEYLGALEQIQRQINRQKIDDMLAKAKREGLTDEEKQTLNRLITQ